nr:MAG TPA: baseplate wedge protein [Caudoviricetes sp.]
MAQFSGSIGISTGQTDKYSLLLDVSEKSYSIENNTSQVEWWVGIRSNTAYHNHYGLSETYKVVINGATVHNAVHTPTVNSSATVWVASGTTTVSHNADGSKSISVSASFNNADRGTYLPTTGSCSGSLKLTTIPRATTPSIDKPSLECGSAIKISGTSASSNFSHKVYVTWNGTKKQIGTIASGTTTPSFSYTIPTDWEKNIPDSTSGIATFTLETISGSTSVGSKTVNATIKVRSGVVPSIGTVSISDTNSICAGIGQYVQSQSKLKFSIATSGNQDSTITSVSTKFNNQTYSGSTFTTQAIQDSGTLTYTITVTDSRGRTATKSGSVTVTAYSPPSLTNVSAKRANSGYAVDESSGTYALLHFKVGFTSLSNKNVTSFYIQYRASGATSWTKINSWANNYTLNQDYKAGNLFTSTTTTFEIAFGVKDKFMSDYSWQIVTVTPTYALINFGKDGKSLTFFGQDGNNANRLTVNGDLAINSVKENTSSTKMLVNGGNTVMYRDWDKLVNSIKSAMYPVGSVYITYNNVNPGTFLGGTWERFGQGRTLVGEGTGNDGSTSMSFTSNSTDGKYKNTHYHVTSFGWDGDYFYAGRPDGAANNAYDRTSVIPNGYGIQTSSFISRQVRLNWTDNRTIDNVQPYIVVFFWRRTA